MSYDPTRQDWDKLEENLNKWLEQGWEIKSFNYDSPKVVIVLQKKPSPFIYG
jgi:hypothetical protein